MKKRILLILFIIIIIIAFFIINSDTYNKSAEEFFNKINKDMQQSIDNHTSNIEQKIAEDGTLGEVTRKLKEGTITNSGVTIIITNRTNVKFNYTLDYSIEEKINNEWTEITLKDDDYNSTYVGSYAIMPNKSVEINLDWSKAYGTLKKGEYRLELNSITSSSDKDYIEFSI